MREQFRVDLRGIVDILSHHLYSSERVYLRELLQNGRDAIEARRRVDASFSPRIDVTPSERNEPMILRDNGIGLAMSRCAPSWPPSVAPPSAMTSRSPAAASSASSESA